jgi:TolB-like protein/Flp pilus assembly protein TadD
VGAWLVQPSLDAITRNGATIHLEPKVMEVLVCLAQHPGEPIPKEKLLQTVWADTFVTDDVLTRSISELRRAFEDDARESTVIQTIPKRGYRLLAAVTFVNGTIATPGGKEALRPAGRSRRDAKTINSLVVLPFTNASCDPDAEYLSEGITEAIINHLSHLSKLRVVPRNTAFRYKKRAADFTSLRRELGVDAAVTGRVVQRGESLVVCSELVDLASEAQLWGERYNRQLSEIFSVQEEIAAQVSEALRLQLTGEERQRLSTQHTQSREAYLFYLKGRYHCARRRAEDLNCALPYFRRAIQEDPGYALAYAGLAEGSILGTWTDVFSPSEGIEHAKRAARKAVEIDPGLADGYTALGFVSACDRDWATVELAFRQAIQLNPGSSLAHTWYAVSLTAMGRSDEAIALVREAQQIDPLSLVVLHHTAWVHYFARRYDEAIAYSREVLEMEPNYSLSSIWLGLAYTEKGMHVEAVTALQRAREGLINVPFAIGFLGHACARAGRRAEAEELLRQLVKPGQPHRHDSYQESLIQVGLGEFEKALDSLEKAYPERSLSLACFAKCDPRLDPLRVHPRFNNLLRLIGVGAEQSNPTDCSPDKNL